MGHSHNDVGIAVTSGSSEVDSDWVGACFFGSSCDGSIFVAFEPGGEVAELKDRIVESKYSELCGVILSYEGGRGERWTEEELIFSSLLGET